MTHLARSAAISRNLRIARRRAAPARRAERIEQARGLAAVGAAQHEAHDRRRALAEGGFGGVDRRVAGGEGRGERLGFGHRVYP
jgi:hypothetical protein